MVQATDRSTMTIKWKLNQLMFERGIKSKDLIEATGFHANTVSKLKNLREMPDRLERETLDKLCKALGVQPGELLVFEPDEASDESDRPSTPPPAPAKASRRSSSRRKAKEPSDRALRDDSTEGWQAGDTFTHGGIDWRVKSVGNRYLKLVNWDSGEEERGFWDTQMQQLQRQGKSA